MIYGFLSGIVVPKGNFFPANLINTDTFLSTIDIPVQVFRAATAAIATISIVGAIRLFNKEMENQLLLYNERLEGIVTDRTRKLISINEQLKEEIQIRKEVEEKLHMLASRILSLKEDERVMIAREIHDEIGQVFTGLKIGISLLTEDMSASKCENVFIAKLKSLSSFIDIIFKRMQSIARYLRPIELDNLGLISAINAYMDDFQKRTGIVCFLLYCKEKEVKLESEKEIAVFRIVQEALINIVRHSNATEACVIIENGNGFLRFSIKDNGRGISDSEISRHSSLGILGMKERALMIGGEFDIGTAEDKGALITVSIPYPQAISAGDIGKND